MPENFDFSHPPFDRLNQKERRQLTTALDIEYFPSGRQMIRPGITPEYLYIIIKGVIHEIDVGGEVTGVYSQGDSLDALSILKRCERGYIAAEESLCYLLPSDIFRQLTQQNHLFEQFFFQSLIEKLETQKEMQNSRAMGAMLVAKVEQAYIHPPVIVDASLSIREAAITMKAKKATSLLVREGEQYGLFSAMDMRDAIIDGRSVESEVAASATFKLITIEADDFLFNAQLLMTRHHIRRLVVKRDREIIGILELTDLISFIADNSHVVMVELDRAETLDELRSVSARFIHLIRALHQSGIKIPFVTALVTELNQKLYRKLWKMLAPSSLIGKSALVVMGSEGRGEQILRTDQDNALILGETSLSRSEIEQICDRFTSTLIELGYPACPGKMMLSNPLWVGTCTEFQERFKRWMIHGEGESMIYLAAFVDAQMIEGDVALLDTLKQRLFQRLRQHDAFYARFVAPALQFETPIGIFQQLVTEKDEHKGELDLKKGGIFTLVHGIRSMAIRQQIVKTNSFERLEGLVEKGIIETELAADLSDALQFLLGLRLKSALQKISVAEDPDNFIAIAELSKIERDSLKESLQIVKGFKKRLNHHFKLSMF